MPAKLHGKVASEAARVLDQHHADEVAADTIRSPGKHNVITCPKRFAQLLSLAWEALVMRERQGCRSVSVQGDTGDVGERPFCRLHARRVDGCASTGVVLLALG
jgi:hypothetical protein